MTIIEKLIAEVLKKEGGFVNHPADKGGATKYGITRATLSNYLGRKCDIDDIESITKNTASDIYEHRYFIDTGINRLPESLMPLMFDMAVNHGVSKAIKLLQEELIDFNCEVGNVDGVIGQRTIAAAKSVMGCSHNTLFINALVERRLAFYQAIVDAHPSQEVFLKGWQARARSFLV